MLLVGEKKRRDIKNFMGGEKEKKEELGMAKLGITNNTTMDPTWSKTFFFYTWKKDAKQKFSFWVT